MTDIKLCCLHCGVELPSGAVLCPQCKEPTGAPIEQIIKCSECGAEVPIEVDRCPNCKASKIECPNCSEVHFNGAASPWSAMQDMWHFLHGMQKTLNDVSAKVHEIELNVISPQKIDELASEISDSVSSFDSVIEELAELEESDFGPALDKYIREQPDFPGTMLDYFGPTGARKMNISAFAKKAAKYIFPHVSEETVDTRKDTFRKYIERNVKDEMPDNVFNIARDRSRS